MAVKIIVTGGLFVIKQRDLSCVLNVVTAQPLENTWEKSTVFLGLQGSNLILGVPTDQAQPLAWMTEEVIVVGGAGAENKFVYHIGSEYRD